eukprot:3865275-Amphidinium_carterae.1
MDSVFQGHTDLRTTGHVMNSDCGTQLLAQTHLALPDFHQRCVQQPNQTLHLYNLIMSNAVSSSFSCFHNPIYSQL